MIMINAKVLIMMVFIVGNNGEWLIMMVFMVGNNGEWLIMIIFLLIHWLMGRTMGT